MGKENLGKFTEPGRAGSGARTREFSKAVGVGAVVVALPEDVLIPVICTTPPSVTPSAV